MYSYAARRAARAANTLRLPQAEHQRVATAPLRRYTAALARPAAARWGRPLSLLGSLPQVRGPDRPAAAQRAAAGRGGDGGGRGGRDQAWMGPSCVARLFTPLAWLGCRAREVGAPARRRDPLAAGGAAGLGPRPGRLAGARAGAQAPPVCPSASPFPPQLLPSPPRPSPLRPPGDSPPTPRLTAASSRPLSTAAPSPASLTPAPLAASPPPHTHTYSRRLPTQVCARQAARSSAGAGSGGAARRRFGSVRFSTLDAVVVKVVRPAEGDTDRRQRVTVRLREVTSLLGHARWGAAPGAPSAGPAGAADGGARRAVPRLAPGRPVRVRVRSVDSASGRLDVDIVGVGRAPRR